MAAGTSPWQGPYGTAPPPAMNRQLRNRSVLATDVLSVPPQQAASITYSPTAHTLTVTVNASGVTPGHHALLCGNI